MTGINFFIIQDQLRRYNEIKQANLPSSVTARKTREFRCPPHEQVSHAKVYTREATFVTSSLLSFTQIPLEVPRQGCSVEYRNIHFHGEQEKVVPVIIKYS